MLKIISISIICFYSIIQAAFAQEGPLIKVDFSEWGRYAKSLENCTPNSFNLPNPLTFGMIDATLRERQKENKPLSATELQQVNEVVKSSTITYTIKGFNDDNCIVTIELKEVPNYTCSFPKADLPIVIHSAEEIAAGSFKLSTDDPVSQLMNKYCQ